MKFSVLFSFLLSCFCVRAVAQPTPKAQLFTDSQLQAQGYRLAFSDDFDSYNSFADLKDEKLINPQHPDWGPYYKWDFVDSDTNLYSWYAPGDVRNYCTTTDNIDIVSDPANSANRLLRLKSTYHTTPLTLELLSLENQAYAT